MAKKIFKWHFVNTNVLFHGKQIREASELVRRMLLLVYNDLKFHLVQYFESSKSFNLLFPSELCHSDLQLKRSAVC